MGSDLEPTPGRQLRDGDDAIGAAAALVAEAEHLRREMAAIRDELVATRQYLRTTQEDRARVLGSVTDALQLARQVAGDVAHIRKATDRLETVVGEVTEKVKAIKLPKWLGTLTQ